MNRSLFYLAILVVPLALGVGCKSAPVVTPEPVGLDDFFDRSVVQAITLEISPDDRQAMFDALPERCLLYTSPSPRD